MSSEWFWNGVWLILEFFDVFIFLVQNHDLHEFVASRTFRCSVKFCLGIIKHMMLQFMAAREEHLNPGFNGGVWNVVISSGKIDVLLQGSGVTFRSTQISKIQAGGECFAPCVRPTGRAQLVHPGRSSGLEKWSLGSRAVISKQILWFSAKSKTHIFSLVCASKKS